jgi:hypothetical protein
MARRAAIVAAACACFTLAACGAPRHPRTIEPDLASLTNASNLHGVQHSTVADLRLLARACPRLDGAIGNAVPDTSATARTIVDAQCRWAFGFSGPASQEAQLLVGIVDDGTYRFHETGDLLDHERTVAHVGDAALYDPDTRTVFALRNGCLWYVQVVGPWPARYAAQPVTTAITRALLRLRETA